MVHPVQLVVLQGIDVCDVVAADEPVVFGVHAFAALVGVAGVACIEEGVADAVFLAQGDACRGECRYLQRGGVFVVIEVILYVACGLHRFIESIVQDFRFVAEAERAQQAECLVADGDVAPDADVSTKFGQGSFTFHVESGVEDVVLQHVVFKIS